MMKAMALAPICAKVSGTSPELLGHAGIVEQNDFALLGKTVGHRRVPMIHRAHEMHVEDERHVPALPKRRYAKRIPLASTYCVGAV